MSAIYGADAIGGVVNIVLRENIPEPQTRYRLWRCRWRRRRAACRLRCLRCGRSRTRLDRARLLRSQSAARSRARSLEQSGLHALRRHGLAFPNCFARQCSLDHVGRICPACHRVSRRYQPASSGATLTPADFLSTAGQRNLESLFRYHVGQLREHTQGCNCAGRIRAHAAAHVPTANSCTSIARSLTQFEPPALCGALVSGENPYNPFGDRRAGRHALDRPGPSNVHASNRKCFGRPAGCAAGYANGIGRCRCRTARTMRVTLRTEELDPMRVAAALTASDPRDALNPFGGSGANSPALLASLLAPAVAKSLSYGGDSIGRVRSRSIGFAAGGRSGTHSRRRMARGAGALRHRSASRPLRLAPTLDCCSFRRIAAAARG